MNQPDLFDRPSAPPEPSISEARAAFYAELRGGPTRCPCCDRAASVDIRRVHAVQARALIHHYRVQETERRSVHFRELRKVAGELTDYPVLVWFGFLEPVENPKDPTKRSPGFYRVTDLGADFVLGRYRVPEKILRWNKKTIRFEGESRSISEVLGEPFDYRTLEADRRSGPGGFEFETDIAGNRRNP
jgi:hypothetical protein